MRRGSRTCATWEYQTSLPWTSSAEASHVRTSAVRASELASLVIAAASGTSSLASLRRCARAGSSSRTSPAAPASGSTPCAESWNASATQRYRSRLRQLIAERPTSAHAFSLSGLLQTLTSSPGRPTKGGLRRNGEIRRAVPSLRNQVIMLPTLSATSYGSNKGGAAGRDGQRQRPSLRALLPTLCASDATRGPNSLRHGRTASSRGKTYPMLNGMVDGPLNPKWLLWFMGFPLWWLDDEEE